MIKIIQQLTNTRPVSDEGPEIITSPSKDGLRVTRKGASTLDVKNGDYLCLVEAIIPDPEKFEEGKIKETFEAKEQELGKDTLEFSDWMKEMGKKAVVVFKGWPANENSPNVGAKLATANGNEIGALGFSSRGAYEMLGGNKMISKHYKIVSDEDRVIVSNDIKYFPIEFDRDEEKKERVRKEKGSSAKESLSSELADLNLDSDDEIEVVVG